MIPPNLSSPPAHHDRLAKRSAVWAAIPPDTDYHVTSIRHGGHSVISVPASAMTTGRIRWRIGVSPTFGLRAGRLRHDG